MNLRAQTAGPEQRNNRGTRALMLHTKPDFLDSRLSYGLRPREGSLLHVQATCQGKAPHQRTPRRRASPTQTRTRHS